MDIYLEAYCQSTDISDKRHIVGSIGGVNDDKFACVLSDPTIHVCLIIIPQGICILIQSNVCHLYRHTLRIYPRMVERHRTQGELCLLTEHHLVMMLSRLILGCLYENYVGLCGGEVQCNVMPVREVQRIHRGEAHLQGHTITAEIYVIAIYVYPHSFHIPIITSQEIVVYLPLYLPYTTLPPVREFLGNLHALR